MFGGSYLNRLSWLRSSHVFLNAVVSSPNTRWLLFNAGQPLILSDGAQKNLAYFPTHDIKSFLGPEPYFGQGKEHGGIISKEEESSFTEAARHHSSPVVFLGLEEAASATSALPSSDFKSPDSALSNIEGTPYFSIDVADLGLADDQIQTILDATELAKGSQSLTWSEPRALMRGLDAFNGSIFAEARSMVDWNLRNKVRTCQAPVRCC